MSRIMALRTVRTLPLTSGSISSSTGELRIAMYVCRGHQSSADGFTAEQLSYDAGSGPRRNDHFRDSLLKRFHGGFQLGLHATGGYSGIDKPPALIRIQCRIDNIIFAADAIYVRQEQEFVRTKGGRYRDRHLIGIHVEELALAIAGQARDNRQKSR